MDALEPAAVEYVEIAAFRRPGLGCPLAALVLALVPCAAGAFDLIVYAKSGREHLMGTVEGDRLVLLGLALTLVVAPVATLASIACGVVAAVRHHKPGGTRAGRRLALLGFVAVAVGWLVVAAYVSILLNDITADAERKMANAGTAHGHR